MDYCVIYVLACNSHNKTSQNYYMDTENKHTLYTEKKDHALIR